MIPLKELKSGLAIPVFGIGTWQMAGGQERDGREDVDADIRAIKAAIDSGITHIDTAELYAQGYAERIIGQATSTYARASLFLVSKVSPENLHYSNLIRSLAGSLVRLQTDYLDLYLVHRDNPEISLRETMRALDDVKEQGLIKNIGVSNFSKERLQEAQNCTQNKVVVNQVHYNLIIREPETTGLLRYCQENEIMLVAYRPLQLGILSKGGIEILDTIAAKYRKTPAQIATNWLISQANVTTVLKTSNIEHLKENLGAVGWEMSGNDIERLRKHFPNQQPKSDIPPGIKFNSLVNLHLHDTE